MGLPARSVGEPFMAYVKCATTTVHIEAFGATYNRGYVPNTARVSCKTLDTEGCPFTLGNTYTFSIYIEQPEGRPGYAGVIFTGYVTRVAWQLSEPSTHRTWEVELIDDLGDLDSFEVDIDGSYGKTLGNYYSSSTLRSNYIGASTNGFVYAGNALQGLKEYDAFRGYCHYGGDGDEEGGLSFDFSAAGFRSVASGTALPGSLGLTATSQYKINTTADVGSLIYSTQNQQWWIPMAFKNEAETKCFVLFMTYIKHPEIEIDKESMQDVFFDDVHTHINLFTQAEYETAVSTNKLTDLSLTWNETAGDFWNNPFFVFPTDTSLYLMLAIPKIYDIPTKGVTDDSTDAINIQPDQAAAATFLETFKSDLPDFITIHFLSFLSSLSTTASAGAGSVDITELAQTQSPEALQKWVDNEYNEMIYTAEERYEFSVGMIDSLPMAVHFPSSDTNHSYQAADVIIQTTEISYTPSDGVTVSILVRKKAASSTSRTFPESLAIKKMKEELKSAPKAITNAEYVFYEKYLPEYKNWLAVVQKVVSDGTTHIITTRLPKSKYTLGENGLLFWKAPLTNKERFNYA